MKPYLYQVIWISKSKMSKNDIGKRDTNIPKCNYFLGARSSPLL